MLKIAFFSPLAPQRSGISDYSEALLPYLARGAEIDLFVDGFMPANEAISSRFQVYDYGQDAARLERLSGYDAVLYHMGNDNRYHRGIYHAAMKYPGIVVLHDFALRHFFDGLLETARRDVEIYLEELAAAGAAAAAAAADGNAPKQKANEFFSQYLTPPGVSPDPVDFPLNRRLAKRAEALIVHSEWSKVRLQEIVSSSSSSAAAAAPIRQIPHLIFPPKDTQQQPPPAAAVQRNQIPGSKPVRIASFGFITPNKGIKRVLRVLSKLRRQFDFRYTLVGKTSANFDVREIIRKFNLEDRVEITEYVSIDEFEGHIAETDIAVNLREQVVGETSGSLCRIMAAGVVAVVSDAGWFAELPENCAVKVDMHNCTDALLEAYLGRLMEDENLRRRLGANAREYMFKYHRIENCAAQYLEFAREVIARRHGGFIKSVAADITRLGITKQNGEDFIRKVAADIAELVTPPSPLLPPHEHGFTSQEENYDPAAGAKILTEN